MGEAADKKVGTWFGPNTVAQVIKKLCKNFEALRVHVALDNTLIVDEIREECKQTDDEWKPLLLFVPLRLGLSEINPLYFSDLKVSTEQYIKRQSLMNVVAMA